MTMQEKVEEEFLGGKLPVCYRETGSLLPRSYQFGTDKPKCSVVACSAVETISNEKLAGTVKKV